MRDKLLIAIAGGVVVAIAAYSYFQVGQRTASARWDAGAITATYLSAQLREIDPSNAGLLLSYELQNNTDTDYRLADAPGVVVMSRLAPDDSLSSQEDVRLAYSTLLPARQRARVTLQLRRSFEWPAASDSALQDKLKEFINQRLEGVEAFVLFDQGERCQIEFPRAWRPFKLASATN